MKCEMCNKEFDTLVSLANHITRVHKISTKEYYNNYMLKCIPLCPICNTTITKYISITVGYNRTCCKKCSAILYRREMKADTDRQTKFVNKVRNNMKNFHDNMTEDEYNRRSTKIGQSLTAYFKSIPDDERDNKLNWFGKLSDTEAKLVLSKTQSTIQQLSDEEIIAKVGIKHKSEVALCKLFNMVVL